MDWRQSWLSEAALLLKHRGARYLIYGLAGWWWPRIAYHLLYGMPRQRLRRLFQMTGGASAVLIVAVLCWLHLISAIVALTVLGLLALTGRPLFRKLNLARLRREARLLMKRPGDPPGFFQAWSDYPVDAETRRKVDAARQAKPHEELVLGRIDSDGRVQGLYGPLPGLQDLGENEFLKRWRFDLDIVLRGGCVLVRKNFRGDQHTFLTEWHNTVVLTGKANVPALYHVDEARTLLYKNLVFGKTIREILVNSGARILHAQTLEDEELAGMDWRRHVEAVWARGKEHLPTCFSKGFFENMEHQLNSIHAQGLAGPSVTYGNIIVDNRTGDPYFIDFDGAKFFRSRSNFAFWYRRDMDRAKYNSCYGQHLLTEQSARAALAASANEWTGWQGAIDFGQGLSTPGFWSVHSATGRWDCFLKPVLGPVVEGKRVLDLCSHHGALAVMMLRAGAKEVVGWEPAAPLAKSAPLVRRLFEWRDLRSYSMHVHTGGWDDLPKAERGRFDLITLLDGLERFPPEVWAAVFRHAAGLAPRLVALVETRRPSGPADKARLSLEQWKAVLSANGFAQVQVAPTASSAFRLLIAQTGTEHAPARPAAAREAAIA